MITRTAPAPTRATTTVTLSAGLINIPLSVFTAVESTSVVRKEFLNGNPDISVGRAPIRRDTEAIIHQADVTRMAQADDGTWVVLLDSEIDDCVGLSGGCEVVSFVPIKDAGQYLTDGLYQVRPKADKKGAGAVSAFSLLLAGMAARKVHALVRFALRGTPRYGLLTTDGDLLLIVPADGVREALPLPKLTHNKSEVTMVCSLIDAIGVETPTVTDDIAPKVQAYINTKAVTGGVAPSAAPAVPAVIHDITAMLEASIAAAKANKKVKAA